MKRKFLESGNSPPYGDNTVGLHLMPQTTDLILLLENGAAALRPHPLSVKLYGDAEPDDTLVESIRKVGVINPIIVDQRNQIVSGNRRFKAYLKAFPKESDRKTRMSRLPVRVIDAHSSSYEHAQLKYEQIVIESNRQRVKTKEQIGREFKELKRIEAALGKIRQSTLNKPSGKVSTGEKKTDKPTGKEVTGKARDIAPSKLGLSGRTAEKLEQVIDAADSGDKRARQNLDAVNDGKKSISEAEKELQQERRRKGFKKNNPKYATKSDKEVDDAIQAKYGTATQLRATNPPEKQTKHQSVAAPVSAALERELNVVRAECSHIVNLDIVVSESPREPERDFDLIFRGISSEAIVKIIRALGLGKEVGCVNKPSLADVNWGLILRYHTGRTLDGDTKHKTTCPTCGELRRTKQEYYDHTNDKHPEEWADVLKGPDGRYLSHADCDEMRRLSAKIGIAADSLAFMTPKQRSKYIQGACVKV